MPGSINTELEGMANTDVIFEIRSPHLVGKTCISYSHRRIGFVFVQCD